MKTSLAIALLIGAWTLIYTGFKEPKGNVLVELQAAIRPASKNASRPGAKGKGAMLP